MFLIPTSNKDRWFQPRLPILCRSKSVLEVDSTLLDAIDGDFLISIEEPSER